MVDIPAPVAGDDEIRLRLHAAGVNPIDTKLRSRGVFFENALPVVLGCDGAGTVESIGKRVTRLQPGDEVWWCHGGLGREQGNYAQYTVVNERIARKKPPSLSFEQAAAAPLILITAWEALFDRARLEPGQTVLVHGGAGGVGHVAIQLAKNAGAKVCTTVGSEANTDFAVSLGADQTIDYRQENFVDAVLDWTQGRGVDVALDIMGGRVFQDTIGAMAHYGSLITLLDPGTDIAWNEARKRNLRIGFELMLTPMLEQLPAARAHQGEILDQCAALADAGKLKIEVTQSLPLEQAASAHQRIESGHTRGKLVLIP
jgi:NADPH2:quinone reductase